LTTPVRAIHSGVNVRVVLAIGQAYQEARSSVVQRVEINMNRTRQRKRVRIRLGPAIDGARDDVAHTKRMGGGGRSLLTMKRSEPAKSLSTTSV